jgi:predicted transcriptional regulator
MKQKLINIFIVLTFILLFIGYTVNAEDDITSPTVIKHSPTGKITKPTIILSVTTDENATCKYSMTDSVNYENMDGIFDTTGKTEHKKSLTNLIDNVYHYYVRCKDAAENIATSDYDASFEVDLAPTAQITLSDPSPIKAGMIEVTLLTSEEAQPTPSLTYSFDGVTNVYVPLAGSGRTWKGYMMIDESSNNKVGSFKFSAIDLGGNTGTVITNGNIFIVDTKKPPIVTSIAAISKKDYIKLVWHYDDENIERYNIYRSTSPGVEYIDFYEDTEENSEFIDHSVSSGETYYYKISVVDKAGNEGDLSKEVHATALLEPEEESAEEEKTVSLSPELIGEVDSVISTVNEVVTEADNSVTNLRAEQQDVVEALSLVSKIEDGKKDLNDLKTELENLKSQDLTSVELDKKLERIKLQVKIIKKAIPDSIILLEESENTQSTTVNDLENTINEVHPEIAEDEKKAYVKKSQQLQNSINVITKIKIVSIGYLDGVQKDFTFIEKGISVKEPSELSNADFIEVIPKSVVEDINEIEFKTLGYEIVKEDPIISWPFSIVNDKKSIKYVINKKVALGEAKKIISIALLTPESLKNESEEKNLVTGFAGLEPYFKINYLGVFIGLFVINCLLVYYFALAKRNKALPHAVGKNKAHGIKKMLSHMIRKIKGGSKRDEGFNKPVNYIKEGKLLKAKDIMNEKIISMTSQEGVENVIKKMSDHEISQILVVDEGIRGVISKSSILEQLQQGKDIKDLKIEEIMNSDPPVISEESDADLAMSILNYHPVILVSRCGELAGVITKSDVLKNREKSKSFV